MFRSVTGKHRSLLAILLVLAMVLGMSTGAYAGEVRVSEDTEERAEVAALEEAVEAEEESVAHTAGDTVVNGAAEQLAVSEEESDKQQALAAIPAGALVINEENFPDENFRKALVNGALRGVQLENDNGVYYIPKEQLEDEYSWISVVVDESYGIKSLSGLEKIPNLYNLKIARIPEITEMPELKNPEALYGLELDDVPISSLGLNKMTSLERLILKKLPLTSLDLSKNDGLYTLELDSLKTSVIDLSQVTMLTTLKLTQMPISTLDLSKLDLSTLDLSGSDITEVNIKQDEFPHDIKLQGCEKLTKVSVSANFTDNSWSTIKLDCKNDYNLKSVHVEGDVDTTYPWGYYDDDTGEWSYTGYDYNFFGCSGLEDVDIAIGKTPKLTVSANVNYDFRYVTGNFSDGEKFKLQSETEPNTGSITIKSSEGSWIAQNYPESQKESAVPSAVELGCIGYDPAIVGDSIDLTYYDSYKKAEDRSRAVCYKYIDGEGERIPEQVANNLGVTITSDNPDVVTVEGKKIKIVGTGTARITVKCNEVTTHEVSSSFYVRAYKKVTAVSTTPGAITIAPSATTPTGVNVREADGTTPSGISVGMASVSATLDPADGLPGIWWHVFDKNNAEVTTPDGIFVIPGEEKDGTYMADVRVTDKAQMGEYTVRADVMGNTDTDSNIISSIINLIVKEGETPIPPAPVEESLKALRLDKTEVTLTVGQKATLTAAPEPSTAVCSYAWKAEMEGVTEENISNYITVDAKDNVATVTAKKNGTVKLSVTATEAKSGKTVTAVASITIAGSDLGNLDDKEISPEDQAKIADELDKQAAKEDGKQLWISGLKAEYKYYGTTVEPEVTVYYGTTRLRVGRDYSITYANKMDKTTNTTPGGIKVNSRWGEGTVTIKGKGNYTGNVTEKFVILNGSDYSATSIKKAKVTLPENKTSFGYTGEAVRPEVTVMLGSEKLTQDTDYTVSYSKNVDAGTANLVVAGIGKYKDFVKKTFKITAVDIKNAKDKTLTMTVANAPYRPGGSTPAVTVKYKAENGKEWILREGVDYKVSYKNNKKISTDSSKAKVIVTGQGNFTKKAEQEFKVVQGDLAGITMSVADLKFQDNQKKGTAFQSKPKIYDADGKNVAMKEYTLTYVDVTAGNITLDKNTSAEDVKKVKNNDQIKVTAKSTNKEYAADSELTDYYFLRNAADVNDINKAKVAVKIKDQTYDGTEKRPSLTGCLKDRKGTELKEGEDFEIIWYSNNVNKGTAKILIKGKGKLCGTKILSFKIVASKLDSSYLGHWDNEAGQFKGK